jgi:O-antigen/teichoic acid export membrane protein
MSELRAESTGPLRRVAKNAASLLTCEVLNKAATFVVYVLVARHADTRAFGQLSLGLLLVYTFQVFACGGLPTLITRDLATERRRTAKYFMAGSVVVAVAALGATLLMALFAVLMHYPRDTTVVLSILALSLTPYALATVTEAIFRAWERMQYIAYANVPINILKMAGAYLMLRAGYGVIAVALLLVACRAATLAIEWALFFAKIERPAMHVDMRYVRRLIRQGSTFLGIDGLIAVWGSLDVILISKMSGEADVGLYSAAWQLLVPASLVFQSAVSSVFPLMCKKVRSDQSSFSALVRWLVEFLLLLGCPVIIGMFALAKPGLLLLYGDSSYLAAANVMRLLLAVLVLQTVTNVLGHALWAGLQERITLRIVAVNVTVNLVAGIFLIHAYGIMGAALAALITWGVNAVQHYLACSRLIIRIPLFATAWKAAVGGGVMAVCFLAMPGTGMVLPSLAAAVAYVVVVGTLLILTAGGLKELRAGYFAPLGR